MSEGGESSPAADGFNKIVSSYNQELTTNSPESFDDQLIDAHFYRFSARDLATFYTAVFAVQMLGAASEITDQDKGVLTEKFVESEDRIGLAAIDALTRELLSGREGNTRKGGAITEDAGIKLLIAQLNGENPYRTLEAQKLFQEHLDSIGSLYPDDVPIIIGETMLGLRLAAIEESKGKPDHAKVKKIMGASGYIAREVFLAGQRNLRPHVVTPPHSVDEKWIDFSRMLETFAEATSPNQEAVAMDSIIGAQHGNGSMLARTCNNFKDVSAILEAKRDQLATHQLRAVADPELVGVIDRYPSINLFADR